MNGKKARSLRTAAYIEWVLEKVTTTVTGYVRGYDAAWGPVPRDENKKVDTKQLKALVLKTPNPKFRGQGLQTEFRYAKGRPTVLDDCTRSFYQKSKKINSAVA
mgnify:CR=1 FL=1|tara:strand:- start:94 stop:405 length:312 start_codon:yes stop_codon:yes gene_type:complete